MDFHLYCTKCKKKYFKPEHVCQHDPYYNYIEINYDYDRGRNLKKSLKEDFFKDLLPLDEPSSQVSLGEGNTSLIRIKKYSSLCSENYVFVKNESDNPTQSFKDRETALAVTKAKELGYNTLAVVSSGNAAISAAVYANKAGIRCLSYIPDSTSKTKKLMLKLFGCDFHFVDGDYEKIYRELADNVKKGVWNITAGKNIYRGEGSKLISYEIWKDLNEVPDIVIVPVGNGSLFSAVFKGFWEMKKIGLTDKIPRMIGVQIKNSSPIKIALEKDEEFAILKKSPRSVAEGIIARESYDSPRVVSIIRSGYGEIMEVSEKEIIKALAKAIKRESLIPEPTSAVVFAALDKLEISSGKKKIVCIQTGSGMKNIEELLHILSVC